MQAMQMLFEFQPDEYLVSVKQPQEWLEQFSNMNR